MKKTLVLLKIYLSFSLALLLALATVSPAWAWDSYDPRLPGRSTHSLIVNEAINRLKDQYKELDDYRDNLAKDAFDDKNFIGGANNELTHRMKHDKSFKFPTDLSKENLYQYAVGSNAGSNFPEYWWQSAVREYRLGNKKAAYFYLGSLLHLIADQAVPAHSYYIQHGGGWTSFDNFEYMGFSNWKPDYYRGLNHEFYNRTHEVKAKNNNWTQLFSVTLHGINPGVSDIPARKVLLVVDRKNPLGDPIFDLRVEYETKNGWETREFSNYRPCKMDDIVLEKEFKSHTSFKVWYKRPEKGSNRDIKFKVIVQRLAEVRDVYNDQGYDSPWEYYEWMRIKTREHTHHDFWRDYYIVGDYERSNKFSKTWTFASQTECSLLSLQQDTAILAVQWALEAAAKRFAQVENHKYTEVDAFKGYDWKVVFYEDEEFNKSDPEFRRSIAISGKAGENRDINYIGNIIPMNDMISSVEILKRDQKMPLTVTLCERRDFGGDSRKLTSSKANLSDVNFSNRTSSIKITSAKSSSSQKSPSTSAQNGWFDDMDDDGWPNVFDLDADGDGLPLWKEGWWFRDKDKDGSKDYLDKDL